jgi:hypothetical protein
LIAAGATSGFLEGDLNRADGQSLHDAAEASCAAAE